VSEAGRQGTRRQVGSLQCGWKVCNLPASIPELDTVAIDEPLGLCHGLFVGFTIQDMRTIDSPGRIDTEGPIGWRDRRTVHGTPQCLFFSNTVLLLVRSDLTREGPLHVLNASLAHRAEECWRFPERCSGPRISVGSNTIL
jgi:hypothetical protein